MKVLLIAPIVYGFSSQIELEIKKKGHDIDFIDEHILSNAKILRKLVMKLPHSILIRLHTKYFLSLLTYENKYDRVIIIRGEYLEGKVIEKLKKHFSQAQFIMYQWDFSKNLPLLSSQIKLFDKAYSFDKDDSELFNIEHKPLFFNRQYKELNAKEGVTHDINFVGTDHSRRYVFIKEFINCNKDNNFKYKIHLFRPLTSLLLAFLKKPTFFVGKKVKHFKVKPSSEHDTLLSMANSKVILDITQPGQNGLTMRTLEALGLQKKLVTTNRSVEQYDFYNSENIRILDSENLFIEKEFVDSPYKRTSKEVYNKYFIDNWVDDFIR
ncbi:hypothetical protein I6E72_09560 [Pseudoalteromonas sp. NSLLW24]|uniref:hypothetical protein n=1 Tax=Pseudoalteromonas sp. NSLLW24 TaxID=2792050 RepID=UPI0018CF76C2|nr:hypothetical protein [Pseudoalteromonas sp. NSLLW24]MBG9999213.1 hypothetical protein [Pseudoalteromonas sp. NSLLW24]